MDVSPIFEKFVRAAGELFEVPGSDVEMAFWTILVGFLSNASCAILGCYLVLRRMSLLGDAISHSILPGLVIAFFLSQSTAFLPMFVGALAMGVLAAFLTQTLCVYGKVAEDASMGVVFTSLFALGVILISQVGRVHLDADCVLYGKIELVSLDTVPRWGMEVPRTLGSLGLVLGMVILFVTAFWKELKLTSFDPMLATAMGLNATLVHYLLMGMVSVVTVASFEAVGSIVVIAMLIVPGATAQLLTDRLGWMIVWSVVVGALSAVLGYLGAVYAHTSVAGMMAVVAGLQFFAAVFLAPKHGLLSKAFHNGRLSLWIVSEDIIAALYRLEERAGGSAVVPTMSYASCARASGGGLTAWLAIPVLYGRGRVAFSRGAKLQLTAAGKRLGESLVRSHRLWEAFLDEHFELPTDHLHEPASRIEHFIGPALQEKLEREVARSDVDPHGRAIPPSQTTDS